MNRKYSCQENFFKTFNEKSCYWLGFIAADGNIALDKYNRPSRLTICLSSKDLNHLIKFKNDIEYTGNIITKNKILKTNNKEYSQSTIRINSRILCDNLFQLGIKNKKSLTLKWINLPKQYISHFIRGYFDGDGCISQRTDHTKNPIIVILGTLEFISKIKEEFSKNTIGASGSIRQRKNIYSLYIAGFPGCYQFMQWIYKDAQTFLDRKYNKFKDIYQT